MTRTRSHGRRHSGSADAGHLEDRIRRARAGAMVRARLSLRWERLWPRLWPLVAVLCGITGIFLTDLLPALPGWLHMLALAVGVLVLVWATRHAVTGHRGIDDEDVLHRIDRDSGFRHDPLGVLDDDIDPETSSPEARSIWAAHRARTLRNLGKLKVALPSPYLAKHDPRGFRAIGFLLLVIGVFAGWGEAGERVARALTPGLGEADVRSARVDIWVTPPSYTGLPPFYLTNAAEADGTAAEAEGIIRGIPVGSRVIAQVGLPDFDDETSALNLFVAGQTVPLDSIGAGGFRADATLGDDQGAVGEARLGIRHADAELAGWSVRTIPDAAPSIFFSQPPSSGSGGQLRIGLVAEDDFGVAGARLVITNPAFVEGEEGGAPQRVELPLPRVSAQSIETTVIRNTAENDWAGLPVELQLEAVDVKGAVGISDPFPMILPERIFNHPIARALAEYRKELVRPNPEKIGRVLIGLDEISRYPQQFGDATSVFLSVRILRARLAYDRDGSEIPSIRSLMWLLALRLEEGEFAVAGRELMETQERVMQALREGAFDEEADRLLDQLQQALDRYMDALAEQLEEQGMEGLDDIPGMEHFDRQDLQDMIDSARDMAETGSMDAAQEMIQQLSQMLQQMQQAVAQGQNGQEQMQQARRMLEDLHDMSRDQEELLDQTFNQLRRMQGLDDELNSAGPDGDQGQRGQQGDQSGEQDWTQRPGEGTRRLAGPQGDLRERLNQMMQSMSELLGSVPPSIGDAAQAMDRAGESLQAGDPGSAVPSQTDALELLRQTTEGMIQMMTQQMREPGSGPNPMQGGSARNGSDPFGQRGGGALGAQMDDGSIRVPDQGDLMRSRQIFDELRRRAGERFRPRIELDYIDRLLTPF